MSTTFINLENSKASDLYRLVLNLIDKMNIKRGDKRVALSYFSIYYIRQKVKKLSGNDKFEISETNWDKESELPDRSSRLFRIHH